MEESTSNGTRHQYSEIGADIFSKPNALCDLVEAEHNGASIVFCNMPSDTDLVKVVLKKRGLNARKVIGNVGPEVTAEVLAEVKAGTWDVVVTTDVGAKDMDLSSFALIVNYSMPGDADVYEQRAGTGSARVVSLVSPLDITTFHQIRKALSYEFSKTELPSKEDLARAKLSGWARKAESLNAMSDERFVSIIPEILKHEKRDQILGFLLYNLFEAPKAAEPVVSHQRRNDEYDRDEDDEGGRGRRGRGGRGRNNRSRRDDDRDEYSSSDARPERSERSNRRDDRDDDYVPMPPPQRDTRIYLGHGTQHGFSEEQLKGLLQKEGEPLDQEVKRFLTRGIYSFFDVREEIADEVLSRIESSSLSDGSKFFARKTVQISEPRPQNERGPRRDERSGEEGQDEDLSSAPTTLAVDEVDSAGDETTTSADQ